MTVMLGLVFVVLVAIFVLSAVVDDGQRKTRRSLDQLSDQYRDFEEREVSDRHWVAKKQLELTATAEMSRIADPG